jgi:glycerol kinase
MKKYVMALDNGSSSVKCEIFDENARSVIKGRAPVRAICPQPGWVEYDPWEILDACVAAAKETMERGGIDPSDVAALGIASQMGSAVVWDKTTGQPIYPMISWQDTRTSDICANLASQAGTVHSKTGVNLYTNDCAPKITWILDNIPGARASAEAGKLLFGTVDGWLTWNLTGAHATDHSSASLTALYSLTDTQWDHELLRMFNIPPQMLPRVENAVHDYGVCSQKFWGAAIPITAVLGDQVAARAGEHGLDTELMKITYGTCCCCSVYTGTKRVMAPNLTTTYNLTYDNTLNFSTTSVNLTAGLVLDWLRDNMGLYGTAAELDELLAGCDDSAGCYFVPAFSGLMGKQFENRARGTIFGLTKYVEKKHIVRAAAESIAYTVMTDMELLEKQAGAKPKEILIDGGISNNDLLMQFQADLLGCKLLRSGSVDATSEGAALAAGFGAGFWPIDIMRTGRQAERVFTPHMSEAERAERIGGWNRAIDSVLYWSRS